MQNNPSQKIYIVDDDQALCKALRWLLESNNFVAETFHSASEFLKSYQTSWSGCLIVDIRMPEMNGLQLLENLKALGNKIPIIMVSGHADIATSARAIKEGVMDFIAKPFNDQHLLQQIQNALVLNNKIHENFN